MVTIPFCIQEKVFSYDLVDELKQSIDGLNRECFFSEKSNGRWGLIKIQPPSHKFINPNDSWFPVTFAKDGDVINEAVTLPFCDYKNIQTIKRIISVALEWMAKKLSFQGQTRKMAISFMQHHNLSIGYKTKKISWHSDASDHTLVILLDDETKWQGGDFFFRIGKQNPKRFQPKRGYGVLFTNQGTQHCVDPFIAKLDGVDRTILTIHEKVYSDL